MEMIKRLEPMWLAIVIVGGINWAIVGLFHSNPLNDLFGGGTTSDVAYAVIGFAALMFVPRLMDELHLGGHTHAHGA